MNNRIGLLLKVKDVTASRFAEMIGVQPSNISHILSGRNKPSLDFVTKVAEAFPDISLDWLLFGKGQMYQYLHNDKLSDQEQKTFEKSIENPVNSEIPDLFSQTYPSESSINDENVDENINEQKEIEQISDNDEDFQKDDSVEDNKIISEEIEAIEEQDMKTKIPDENIDGILEKKIKPNKIIFVYPDDTFEIFDTREK